jgi:restriction system protein
MNFRDAAEHVLREAGEPVHYRDLTRRALDAGLLSTRGRTPWETLNAQLSVDIKQYGERSRFYRHAPGTFGLRAWGRAPAPVALVQARSVFLPTWTAVRALLPVLDGMRQSAITAMRSAIRLCRDASTEDLTWADPEAWAPGLPDGGELARTIWRRTKGLVNPRYIGRELALANRYDLLTDANGTVQLTERGRDFLRTPDGAVARLLDDREGVARVLGLVAEHGPARTGELYEPWMRWCEKHSNIGSESTGRTALSHRLRNLEDRGHVERQALAWAITPLGLERLGRDPDAVATDDEDADPGATRDLLALIQAQQQRVREQVRAHLQAMDPYAFEHLIRRLLEEMGYDDVAVTKPSNDKGVDVVGKIEVGITSVQEVVQVKRLRSNVQRPVLDGLRGSLHRWKAQRGTIITTSGFSKGTRDAAFEPGAAPITLIDGDKLVELLIANDIGVRKEPVKLWKFDAADFAPPETLDDDA